MCDVSQMLQCARLYIKKQIPKNHYSKLTGLWLGIFYFHFFKNIKLQSYVLKKVLTMF